MQKVKEKLSRMVKEDKRLSLTDIVKFFIVVTVKIIGG